MEYVWEIVLTVLCLMGLGLLVWCLMGRLVCPVPGQEVLAVLEGQGDGGGLEQSVRALMWLRSLGLLRCPVVIVDLGLDREGLAVAQRLALRWPVVDLYRPEDGAEAHRYKRGGAQNWRTAESWNWWRAPWPL